MSPYLDALAFWRCHYEVVGGLVGIFMGAIFVGLGLRMLRDEEFALKLLNGIPRVFHGGESIGELRRLTGWGCVGGGLVFIGVAIGLLASA